MSNRRRTLPAASALFRVPSSEVPSPGLTLVEILVVIAIIGILAALITPAIYQAMWSARQTKIKTELDQLASGIEAFKAKYGLSADQFDVPGQCSQYDAAGVYRQGISA